MSAVLPSSSHERAFRSTGLEVRPAGDKGLGLFATRPFDCGETIGIYTGTIASRDDFAEALQQGRSSGDYAIALGTRDDYFFDAEDPDGRCAVAYINHNLRRRNCLFGEVMFTKWLPCVPYVVTSKPIAAGEELWVWLSPNLILA
jgi:hypothetical protein